MLFSFFCSSFIQLSSEEVRTLIFETKLRHQRTTWCAAPTLQLDPLWIKLSGMFSLPVCTCMNGPYADTYKLMQYATMKAVLFRMGFSIRGQKGCKPMLSVPGAVYCIAGDFFFPFFFFHEIPHNWASSVKWLVMKPTHPALAMHLNAFRAENVGFLFFPPVPDQPCLIIAQVHAIVWQTYTELFVVTSFGVGNTSDSIKLNVKEARLPQRKASELVLKHSWYVGKASYVKWLKLGSVLL